MTIYSEILQKIYQRRFSIKESFMKACRIYLERCIIRITWCRINNRNENKKRVN